MVISTSLTANETPAIDTNSWQTKVASPSSRTVSGSDTVHLSQTAQAAALHHQGMSVKQIAADLGLTAQEVDSYLGIPAAGSTASTVAASSSSQVSSASASSALPSA